MEQIRALNALEPFLALTKSATTPALAADVVGRALSHPDTYVFAPLLSNPQIAALATSQQHAGSHALLKIFAYGTYAEYTQARNHSTSLDEAPSLPELIPAQAHKLRQLSLLSLAGQGGDGSQLTYDTLLAVLALSSTRELEDLVISAIYAGLLVATLDPYRGVVRVQSVSALRDVAPDSIPQMVATLERWSERCTNTLMELEERVRLVRLQAKRRKWEETNWERRWTGLVETQMQGGSTGKEKSKDGNHHEDGKNHAGSSSTAQTTGQTAGGVFKGFAKKLGSGSGSGSSSGAGKRKEGAVPLEEDEYQPPHNPKESKEDRPKGKGHAPISAPAAAAGSGVGSAAGAGNEDVEMADPEMVEDEGYVGRVTRSAKKRGAGIRGGLSR